MHIIFKNAHNILISIILQVHIYEWFFLFLKLSLCSNLSKLTELTTLVLAVVFTSSSALVSIVVNFERSDNFANSVKFKDIQLAKAELCHSVLIMSFCSIVLSSFV